MEHIFLINAKGSNEKIENKIYKICKEWGLDFKIMIAESKQEMQEYVRNHKNDKGIIYAVGGDGTLNVVLNEMIDGKAKLGIIPSGTGNDFYRSLDQYKSEIIDVNVMKVNEQYGINIFSLGIDATICEIKEQLKNYPIPKSSLYYLSTLYAYFKYKNQVMGINNFFQKLTLLAVCNGPYYGKGHKIAPRATIHTPDVFIMSVTDMPKLEMPFFWWEVMRGVHEDNPYVDLYRTEKEIHIETMNSLVGQLDGELLEGNEFRVVPNASNIEIVNNRQLIRELKK